MRVAIVGHGYVGSSVAYSHSKDDLVIRDPKFGLKSATISEVLDSEAIYICLPTPSLEDGRCEESFVVDALKELREYRNVIICKSTLPPNSYKNLQKEYENLVHVPEFLTQANSISNYINSKWVLLGGNENFCKKAIDVIKRSSINACSFHITNIQTASLFKYLANTFLATKVTFMNDFFNLASALDVSWEDIKSIVKYDERLGSSHWDVPGPDGKFGFAGACFPKDVAAIIQHGLQLNSPMPLLDRVQIINKLHRALPQTEKPPVKSYCGGKPNYCTPEETFTREKAFTLDRECWERGCMAHNDRDGNSITISANRLT